MNARDYFTLLREHKFLITACVLLCVIAAGVLTYLTPKSYASSVVYYVVAGNGVAGSTSPSSDSLQGATLSMERIKSYIEVVTGPRVAEDAARALGEGVDPADVQSSIAASSVEGTVLFTVTATSGSPDQAVAIVDAVARAFSSLVRELEVPRDGTSPIPVVRAEVIQSPTVPDAPVSPSMSVNLAIGAIIGLLIGFGAAIARRTLDVSVRSTEALEAATEAAVLGVVPEDSATAKEPVALAAAPLGRRKASARAEAYRRIRTNLEYSNVDGTRRVLVITSAQPDDGKTVTACNLAAALAAVGAKVILVDGDLRRPKVAGCLGLENTVGLTGVLTGRVTLEAALQRWSGGGFDVLASGRTPPRPNELLSSRRAGEFIAELRDRYDFVLIDAPPINPVVDAANIGVHSDGAIVVCRWGKTSRHHVKAAVSFLRSVSVPVVGTVLSRAPRKSGATWSYYNSAIHPEMDQLPPPAPGQPAVTNGSSVTHVNGSKPKPETPPEPATAPTPHERSVFEPPTVYLPTDIDAAQPAESSVPHVNGSRPHPETPPEPASAPTAHEPPALEPPTVHLPTDIDAAQAADRPEPSNGNGHPGTVHGPERPPRPTPRPRVSKPG